MQINKQQQKAATLPSIGQKRYNSDNTPAVHKRGEKASNFTKKEEPPKVEDDSKSASNEFTRKAGKHVSASQLSLSRRSKRAPSLRLSRSFESFDLYTEEEETGRGGGTAAALIQQFEALDLQV